MSDELTPLKRAIYLLEDIPVSAERLQRELSEADQRALVKGLGAARGRFATATSEQELQWAANDLLTLVENRPAWRQRLLPIGMPNKREREQWLEIREEELQANPEQAPDVEALREVQDNLDLGFEQAITALLPNDDEDVDE